MDLKLSKGFANLTEQEQETVDGGSKYSYGYSKSGYKYSYGYSKSRYRSSSYGYGKYGYGKYGRKSYKYK